MISDLLSKICGILPNEWPRVLLSWGISLCSRMGYVIGWTVITAIFVYKMGIANLPFLYVAYACFSILGTLIYSLFNHRLSKELNIILSIVLGSLTIFCANFFASSNDLIFFTLVMAAAGIFFTQLGIGISIFTEEIFSPLESQRVFPLIESAETIGGVLGGLIVVILIGFSPPHYLFYVWIIVSLGIIPLLLIHDRQKRKVPIFASREEEEEKSGFKIISQSAAEIKNNSFLRGMLLVVVFNWVFLSLLDFQFTKALDFSLHSAGEANRVEAYTEKLTEGLGKIHILFSLSALMTQLFLAGRMIKKLGIIGSLVIHPLVAFFNTVNLTLNFNLATAIVNRTGFEITGSVHKNAYHSSYYALPKKSRHRLKEFLEGIGKAIGIIFGFVTLFVLIRIYQNQTLSLSINITMIFITVIMIITLLAMQNRYTSLAKKALLDGGEGPERFQAIEILSQKGHKKAGDLLAPILADQQESERVKAKILVALGEIQDLNTIPEITEVLLNGKKELKLEAIQALARFTNLDRHFLSQAVSRYRITDSLRKIFQEGGGAEIKAEIIRFFARFNQSEMIPFIFTSIDQSTGAVKAGCIKALQAFDDISAAYYVKKYQNDPSPEVQIAVADLMWKFPKLKDQVRKKIEKLRKSGKTAELVLAMKIIGAIDIKKYSPLLKEQAENKDPLIKNTAIQSLAQMAENDPLQNMIKDAPKTVDANQLKSWFQSLPTEYRSRAEKEYARKICTAINKIHQRHGQKKLEELPLSVLRQLKSHYEISGDYHEVERINKILKSAHD